MIFVEQMYSTQPNTTSKKCTKNISNEAQAAKESLTCSTHLDFSPIKANLGVKAAAVKKWILTTAAQQPVYYESRGQAINASLELTS